MSSRHAKLPPTTSGDDPLLVHPPTTMSEMTPDRTLNFTDAGVTRQNSAGEHSAFARVQLRVFEAGHADTRKDTPEGVGFTV